MSKQGRPKSKKTLEKERVAKLFSEIKKSPGYIYKGPEIDFVQADKVEKQILKQYRVSAAITKTIAFAMASLGFETSAKEDKQTIYKLLETEEFNKAEFKYIEIIDSKYETIDYFCDRIITPRRITP